MSSILMPENITAKLRDQTANCDLRLAARCCMAVANGVQQAPDPGARLMGLAAAFLLAAEASGIPSADLMAYARNCIHTAEGRRPEFAAAARYIEQEVING